MIDEAQITVFVLVGMILVSLAGGVCPSLISRLGIIPRQISGLPGVLFAPLIHGGPSHLAANMIPFSALCFIVTWIYGSNFFLGLLAWLWVLSGFFTWFLGKLGSSHVGMSGVVYGFVGFLISRPFVGETNSTEILTSLLVAIVFAPILLGIFRFSSNISLIGHLGGFASGILYLT